MLGTDLDPDDSYEWGAASSPGSRPTRSIECDIVPGAGFAAVRDPLLTDPERAVHGVDIYRVAAGPGRRGNRRSVRLAVRHP